MSRDKVKVHMLLNNPITILKLNPRAYKCLKNNNINKISDLLSLSINELREIEGFGRLSFKETIEKLELIGFSRFDFREDCADKEEWIISLKKTYSEMYENETTPRGRGLISEMIEADKEIEDFIQENF